MTSVERVNCCYLLNNLMSIAQVNDFNTETPYRVDIEGYFYNRSRIDILCAECLKISLDF